MPKWLDFVIGVLLWAVWGVVLGAVGVTITRTPKMFWPIWIMTLLLVIWNGVKHHFVKE